MGDFAGYGSAASLLAIFQALPARGMRKFAAWMVSIPGKHGA
jgi:hypothetical protein